MRKSLMMLAVLTPLLAFGQTVTSSYNGLPLQIFPDDANVASVVRVFVPRSLTINSVTASVQVQYSGVGDLNVFMYSPQGTRTKLLERNCGSLVNIDTTFDDAASTTFASFCPTEAGRGPYAGIEPLANSKGQNSYGYWRLAVENNGSDDFIGYLRGFTLVFTGTAVTTKPITGPNFVFNTAGFQSAVVAPGEMINISGFNLGPATGVLAPAGNLPTSLSGVQVTFDGVAAALSYVSQYTLTAQAPFTLQPGGQTAMTVTYQSSSSDPVKLDVLSVVPGVYTQSANGKGLVTAVNQDGSTNSLTNPAPKGSYVTVYAVGLGTLDPALAAGQVPPNSPLSYTTTTVSASIDGYIAPVSFAGAAPGFVGLYQVNLQIPANAGSGSRALALWAGGGAPSQNDVMIWVK